MNEDRRGKIHYDEAFRRHAVELVERGDRSIEKIAAELGIRPWTLRKWRVVYTGPDRSKMTEADKDAYIAKLQAELSQMQQREDILKKSLGILSDPPRRSMPKLGP